MTELQSFVDTQRLLDGLERYRARLAGRGSGVIVQGSLMRTVGLVMEARGIHVAIGERCFIENEDKRLVSAEVVGFDGDRVLLMAETRADGLAPGARVIPGGGTMEVGVGDELLGRVIDSSGQPIDGHGPVKCSERLPLFGHSINPMRRALVEQPLDVGVRAINALFTVGRGARLGLFAGSGVGKSVLLGMMARYTSADVVVVGLIGERSREVKEFVERILGAGLKKAVVVAAPASDSALARVHGAYRATAIAEYFRDRGQHVLLLMDSLTRLAMAQREIGLAVGEIPASRGYPATVFGRIASLCERAGNGADDNGSITAFYTVLIEADDPNDPIGDAARSILDGHLVLSRGLADRGHFPAIDVGASVSRVMPAVVRRDQIVRTQRFKQLYTRFEESRDMIAIGGYRAGNDAELDRAVALQPTMDAFLCQDMTSAIALADSVAALAGVLGE
ncbi:MAG: FliI/YscN family ATPase [Alphaproteobacteria bacterium]|nr:FliI/YscN family ATPase [Alphaproteobacteria bacterium]